MSKRKRLLYFIALAMLIQGTSLIILDVCSKFLDVSLSATYVITVIVAIIYTFLICTCKIRIRLTSYGSRVPNQKER